MELCEYSAKVFIIDKQSSITEAVITKSATLGTENCDIIVSSDVIPSQYGEFYCKDDEFYYKNLTGQNMTYINSSLLKDAEYRMADGDIITIRSEANTSDDCVSIIFSTSYSECYEWTEIDISADEEVSIGREHGGKIFLTDKRVSRKHAIIEHKGADYVLSDRHSKNGVHLNGKRIVAPATLSFNDVIRIVGTYFFVHGSKLFYANLSDSENVSPFFSTVKMSPEDIDAEILPPEDLSEKSTTGPKKLKIEWTSLPESDKRTDTPLSVSKTTVETSPDEVSVTSSGGKKLKFNWTSLPDTPASDATAKSDSPHDDFDSETRMKSIGSGSSTGPKKLKFEWSSVPEETTPDIDKKDIGTSFDAGTRMMSKETSVTAGPKKLKFEWSSAPETRTTTDGGRAVTRADVYDAYPRRQLNIQIQNRIVRQKRKKVAILKDINMTINSGEFVLILGGSGAGKTTFINAVMGYEKANGRILYDGINIYTEYERMKYEIGFVPQQDLMRDGDTVYDTLDNSARMKLPGRISVVQRQERVREVLELLGLSREQDSIVSKLSGGQRKRLSIAIEYIADPSLFFLDEPDSGLDGIMARSLMENLRTIADQGKIVMVISHAPDRAAKLFDKVIVLAKSSYDNCGKLAFYGSVDEAYEFFDAEDLESVVRRINRADEGGDGKADYYIDKFMKERGAKYGR